MAWQLADKINPLRTVPRIALRSKGYHTKKENAISARIEPFALYAHFRYQQ
jgi:hypothetical protein